MLVIQRRYRLKEWDILTDPWLLIATKICKNPCPFSGFPTQNGSLDCVFASLDLENVIKVFRICYFQLPLVHKLNWNSLEVFLGPFRPPQRLSLFWNFQLSRGISENSQFSSFFVTYCTWNVTNCWKKVNGRYRGTLKVDNINKLKSNMQMRFKIVTQWMNQKQSYLMRRKMPKRANQFDTKWKCVFPS